MNIIIISIIVLFFGVFSFLLGFYYSNRIQKTNNKILSDKKEYLEKELTKLEKDFSQKKDTVLNEYISHQNQLNQKQKDYENTLTQAKTNYLNTIEKEYINAEKDYDKKMQILKTQESLITGQILDLKNQLSAGTQARLREQEKKEKINFYKLNINNNELKEILALDKIKDQLKQPVILSKLIWTTYFQKQTNDLCNRVLGTTSAISGIYKITNLETEQCYIGQSVDIAARFKQHIKCGLGIDAPATNKLYKAMQETGVWNFSFEILEKCDRTALNEKEKFWIQMYQTNSFGYNTTKGGS